MQALQKVCFRLTHSVAMPHWTPTDDCLIVDLEQISQEHIGVCLWLELLTLESRY